MNKLHFLTAGLPLSSEGKGYKKGLNIINEMDLDGLEVEFVHGVRMNDANQALVQEFSKQQDKLVTCHGPYYINLNSQEEEKIEASVERILETARMGQKIGAYSITFHAAFYMKQTPEEVYKTIYKSMERICSTLEAENNNIWIRPETTGKGTQWGTLEEIVQLSKEFKNVLPCIDFAHIHARNNGIYNTYDEFSKMLEYVGKELGNDVFNNFHAHLAGIEYSVKGEKNHLIFEESDMNYKDLLKVFKEFNVKGALVCESPNIELDTKLLKDYYLSL
ncbi:MAG: TIM barrel protein [Candidatus Gastranaerophilales bacterium]|nr:TIM barrel protein [Candidatus Gastranaerophilales bacterium]